MLEGIHRQVGFATGVWVADKMVKNRCNKIISVIYVPKTCSNRGIWMARTSPLTAAMVIMQYLLISYNAIEVHEVSALHCEFCSVKYLI